MRDRNSTKFILIFLPAGPTFTKLINEKKNSPLFRTQTYYTYKWIYLFDWDSSFLAALCGARWGRAERVPRKEVCTGFRWGRKPHGGDPRVAVHRGRSSAVFSRGLFKTSRNTASQTKLFFLPSKKKSAAALIY